MSRTTHRTPHLPFILAAFLPLLLTALIGFAPAAHSKPADPPADKASQAFRNNPKDGIRDLFLSFQEDMINYEKGELKSPENVFALLEFPPEINKDQEFSYLMKKAKRLFLIIQSLIFDYELDLPDAPADSNKASVTMKIEDGPPFTFHMIKKHGHWVFSAETLENPQLKKIYLSIKNRFDKFTNAAMEGDTFTPGLMSPYRTMLLLRSGVLGNYGLTLEDATEALDLSAIEPALRADLGETLAVRLYRVLHFLSPLDMEQLSANPHTESVPVFLVVPGFGAVTMHVVTDKDGIKSWRFTPKSLDVIRRSYDMNMKTIIDQGNNPFIGANLPLGVLADDLVQKKFPFLEREFFGVDLWKYVSFIILGLLTPLLARCIRFISRIIMSFLRRRSPETMGRVSDTRISLPLTVIVLGYLWANALLFLVTGEDKAAIVLVILNIIMIMANVWILATVIWLMAHWLSGRSRSRTGGTAILVAGQVIRIIIMVVGLIKIAAIFGQDSTRVLAALGIGGVAIALAGKNTVENIFGTVMIVTTRPFAIGHYIIVNDIKGVVEHVGLRSTTIRTFHNSLVTVPNSHFITSPVDNMGKRNYRRFQTTLGVAYDTPPEKITAFVGGLRELAMDNQLVDKSRLYIRANDFGPSSIDIVLDIHLQVADREEELEVRERYVLDAIYLAEMLEVEFAFPTRTLYLRNEDTPGHDPLGGERRGAVLGKEAASLILKRRKEEEEGKTREVPDDSASEYDPADKE